MQIAILLFDRFTALDAVGPYQVFSSLPGADVVFAAEQAGRVSDNERSLHLSADAMLADVPHPDIVVVPGGPGQNDQMADGPLHDWLRAADQNTAWTTSVCTCSLISPPPACSTAAARPRTGWPWANSGSTVRSRSPSGSCLTGST